MHIDDATTFIVGFIRNPRNGNYSSYGYDVYLPNVVRAYVVEVEKSKEHDSGIPNSARGRELSRVFYDAGWGLCRRGVLRPGITTFGAQSTGADYDGYSVTELGRSWIEKEEIFELVEPTRLGRLFESLSLHLGR